MHGAKLCKIKPLFVQADLYQEHARLELQINRNQLLTTQLWEKDEELRRKNADISRLQGEVQTLQVIV